MKLLKSRCFACFIMVILIIFSICFSTYRSLNTLYAKTNAVFYDSSNSSVQSCLENRILVSNKISNLAKKYFQASSASVSAVTNAANNLSSVGTPSQKCSANNELSQAVDELYYEMNKSDIIVKSDLTELSSYYNSFNSYNDTIIKSTYNQAAEEYNKVKSEFPSNIFSALMFIPNAELFK